jgi:malate dehydrogenase
MKKISIIGAGNVGATAADLIGKAELGDVILVDVVNGMPKGKALDISESKPLSGSDAAVEGTNDIEDTKGSDIIIITAGIARKPGMSRDDLLSINAKIVSEVTEKSSKISPDAIIIVVTNPLDVMVHIAAKVSKFAKNKVIGMAGILDSIRFRTFIARELGVSVKDVSAMVLGGHGSLMVPLARYATVSSIPLTELMPDEKIKAAVLEMVRAIVKDKKRVLPCASYCNTEYGANGYFIGVPVILGKNGVEKVIELQLNDEEKEDFSRSVEHVKGLIASLGNPV